METVLYHALSDFMNRPEWDGLECLDESLTQQHQAEEADINTIVRRFGVTGHLPESARPVFFGDFDDVFDFQSAQNAVIAADRAFMALPADLRARFANDPQKFVEFCSDEANVEELRKLGLAKAAAVVDNEPVAPGGPASGESDGEGSAG